MKIVAIASLVLGGGILTNIGAVSLYQTNQLTPEQIQALKAEEARQKLPEPIRKMIPVGTPESMHGHYIGLYKGWLMMEEIRKQQREKNNN